MRRGEGNYTFYLLDRPYAVNGRSVNDKVRGACPRKHLVSAASCCVPSRRKNEGRAGRGGGQGAAGRMRSAEEENESEKGRSGEKTVLREAGCRVWSRIEEERGRREEERHFQAYSKIDITELNRQVSQADTTCCMASGSSTRIHAHIAYISYDHNRRSSQWARCIRGTSWFSTKPM